MEDEFSGEKAFTHTLLNKSLWTASLFIQSTTAELATKHFKGNSLKNTGLNTTFCNFLTIKSIYLSIGVINSTYISQFHCVFNNTGMFFENVISCHLNIFAIKILRWSRRMASLYYAYRWSCVCKHHHRLTRFKLHQQCK